MILVLFIISISFYQLCVEEIVTEVRETCDKMQAKIEHLKDTTFKDVVEKFLQEIDSILEVLSHIDENLDNRSAKEIEKIKDEMLSQFDKASSIERELDIIYTKESFMRQFIDNPPETTSSTPNRKPSLKKCQSNVESHFEKLKKITSQTITYGKPNYENNIKSPIVTNNTSRLQQHSFNLEKFAKGISSPANLSYTTQNKSVHAHEDLSNIDDYKAYRKSKSI